MTFNSDDFLKTNLIEALKNDSFEPEKVNIFAFNYKQNGDITADSFNTITQAVTDYQAELAKEASEAQSESGSDSTSDSNSVSDSTSEATSETAS